MEKLVGQLPTFFLWSNPWAWLSLCFMASWQMIALMVYHLSRSKGFQTHLCDLSEFKRPTIHRAYLIHENSCSTWKDLSLIKLSIIRLLYTVKKENKKHTYSKFRIEQYQMIFWLLLRLILANAFIHVDNIISKPVNSNLGWETSHPVYIPLLPRLSASRAAWLVWTQQKQDMSSLNLNFSLQA